MPELGPDGADYYHSLIGVLRSIVELDRGGVNVEASVLSSHLAMPIEVHLEELLHIFAYMSKHTKTEMVFDPSVPNIDKNYFQFQDWSYLVYSSQQSHWETASQIRTFVDADHAGEYFTQRSRTGFIIILNSASIYWYTNKKFSVHTSTFGNDFMAMKQATEYVKGL